MAPRKCLRRTPGPLLRRSGIGGAPPVAACYLPGDEAILRREGERLILEPAPAPSLLGVLAGLQPLEEEFPPVPDAPAEPVEL